MTLCEEVKVLFALRGLTLSGGLHVDLHQYIVLPNPEALPPPRRTSCTGIYACTRIHTSICISALGSVEATGAAQLDKGFAQNFRRRSARSSSKVVATRTHPTAQRLLA